MKTNITLHVAPELAGAIEQAAAPYCPDVMVVGTDFDDCAHIYVVSNMTAEATIGLLTYVAGISPCEVSFDVEG